MAALAWWVIARDVVLVTLYVLLAVRLWRRPRTSNP